MYIDQNGFKSRKSPQLLLYHRASLPSQDLSEVSPFILGLGSCCPFTKTTELIHLARAVGDPTVQLTSKTHPANQTTRNTSAVPKPTITTNQILPPHCISHHAPPLTTNIIHQSIRPMSMKLASTTLPSRRTHRITSRSEPQPESDVSCEGGSQVCLVVDRWLDEESVGR